MPKKKNFDYSDLTLKLNIENILNNSTRRIFDINYNKMYVANDMDSLKFKINKNVLIIGLAWTLLFTAFQSMANLQSSLNNDQGLGTASLSTIYITLVFSSMFLPPLLIGKLGTKWTIVLCQLSYLFYIAANIVPRWSTLIPSAFLLGTFACGLWSAKCTYLTELAYLFSELTTEESETVVNRFFGIFFAMFQTSQIFGNLISSLVLKPPSNESYSFLNISLSALTKCGSNDCPMNQPMNEAITAQPIQRPQSSTVYTLCFIYLTLALLSIALVAIFLDSFDKDKAKPKSSTKKENIKFDLLMSTLKHMNNTYQVLLIPLTLWMGFSLAYIGADYTKSFVACSKGVDKIGFAMICFGLTNAFGSYTFGRLHKYLGRNFGFLISASINYITIFVMIVWKVNLEQDYVFYLIPALWGIADSIWQTQVNSLYGVLFKENQNAAFSNFRLWESLGFAISYAYSNYFCTLKKLFLLLIFLTLGMIGYALIELIESGFLNENHRIVKSFNKLQIFLFGFLIIFVIIYILM